jgi:hypothetical protein
VTVEVAADNQFTGTLPEVWANINAVDLPYGFIVDCQLDWVKTMRLSFHTCEYSLPAKHAAMQ